MQVMTLESDARRMADDVDSVSVDAVIDIMEGILPAVVSGPVSEYLQKKIDALKAHADGGDDNAIRILCNSLRPYAAWYIQGIDAKRG